MQQAGILVPVTQSTPWISSYVNVKSEVTKGGKKFCICLDLTNLNKAILHEPFFTLNPNDVYAKLSKAKMLTVINFKEGFWQVELDEGCSYLMTFNTPFGHIRITHLPFGLPVSGDIFQHKLDTIYGDLPLTISCADDMIIWGEKDDIRPWCSIRQIPTSYKKTWAMSRIWQDPKQEEEISFYGDTYTVNGHKPAEEKKKAIAEMPRPTNMKELQSFLGVCNFLSKYSTRLAELFDNLCQLTCKGIPFNWGPEHMEAFNALQEEITSAPVLWPKETTSAAGGCKLERPWCSSITWNQSVYFTSKVLPPCQWSYVALELEALTVGWAVKKFHHFLYGWQFTIETDKKLSSLSWAKDCSKLPHRCNYSWWKPSHMTWLCNTFMALPVLWQTVC